MNTIFRTVSLKAAVVTFVAVAGLLSFAPRHLNITQAESCSNPPTEARLNVYDVTFTDHSDCKDFPAISVHNTNDSTYAYSANAQAGEEVYVRMYVHNGAAQNPEFKPGSTARNVRVNTSISGNTISMTAQGDNTNVISGSATINIPAGAHLEVVSDSGELYDYQANQIGSGLDFTNTTYNLGDMEACFEHLRTMRFKVRVVAPVVEAPSGTISGRATGRVGSECLVNAHIVWTSQNVTNGLVTINNPDLNSNNFYDNDKIFAANTPGDGDAPWMSPNTAIRFSLWDIDPNAPGAQPHTFGGSSYNAVKLAETWVEAGPLDCGAAPVTPPTISPVVCAPANQNATVNQTVSFSVTGGTGQAAWYKDGVLLSDFSDNVSTSFATAGTHSMAVLKGSATAGYCYVNVSTIVTPISPSGSIAVTTPQVCVGTTGTAVVTANANVEYEVRVNSPTGQLFAHFGANDQMSQATGNWVDEGTVFYLVQKGTNTVLAQTVAHLTNSGCVTTPTPPPVIPALACIVNGSASVGVNQTVIISATGGSGTFNWFAPGSQSTISGNMLSASYSTAGDKTITVSSTGSNPANCVVHITAPQVASLVCSPSNTFVDVNKPVYLTAFGGNGTFNWSAAGGSPASGSGLNFQTSYNTAGDKIVTVSDGTRSATCNVKVNAPVVVCVPNSAMVLSNGAIVNNSNGTFSTIVNYNFAGNNAVRVVYTNPDNNQDVEFVNSATGAGSKGFTFNPNKTYYFKMVDTANCGAIVTLVVRKDVSTQCVINGNPVLTVSGPTKDANGTYSANISWSSAGNNQIKVSFVNPDNNQESVLNQAGNSGSVSVHGLQQGKSYSFNMFDAACTVLLATRSVYIPVDVQPTAGYLSIDKLVAHGGVQDFAKSIVATSGDRVTYKVTVTANNGTVNNISVTDVLPNGSTLVNGTLKLDNSSLPDGQFSNINIGTLTAGQSRTIIFDAYVTAQNGVAQTVLTNTASASGQSNNQTVGPVSSSATVYINQVINNGFAQLSIAKTVVNLNTSNNQNSVCYQNIAFQKNANANTNDQVAFKIVVTNTGTQTVNNVRVSDTWTGNMNLQTGTVRISDGSQNNCNNASDSLVNGNLSLGSLTAGQSKTITFVARVNGNQNIQNTAVANGDNVPSVSDSAWVFVTQVAGQNVSLNFSKHAFNDTKNVDAQSMNASKEDFVTYTLSVQNTGNAVATNFVITDDLSQVLPYADMVDNGGAQVNGNVITFPGIDIPAGGSVSKSFRVRVKYFLANNLSYTMTNTYGNTVVIHINTPQVAGAFIAPKTGADTLAFVFAGILTLGFALWKKKELIGRIILN